MQSGMQEFLATLLANSLVAIVLALAGACVWRFSRQSPIAHALFLVALIKLVTPPLFEVGLDLGFASAAAPEAVTLTPGDELTAAHGPMSVAPMSETPAARIPEVEPARSWSALGVTPAMALFCLWALGTLITILRLWRRGRLCHRLLLRADGAPDGVVQTARQLAEDLGLRSYPEIRIVDARVSPCVFALGRRATVVLPRQLLASASPGDLQAVLAHELSHIANRDHFTRWLEVVVMTVHWWNPIAWWIRRQLDELGEVRCDARAVAVLTGGARSYGHAILRITSQLEVDPAAIPLGASGFGGSKILKRRIVMIAESKLTHRLTWPARCAVFIGAFGLLPLGLNAQDKKETKKDLAHRILEALDEQGVLNDKVKKAVHKALGGGVGAVRVEVEVESDGEGENEDVRVIKLHKSDGGWTAIGDGGKVLKKLRAIARVHDVDDDDDDDDDGDDDHGRKHRIIAKVLQGAAPHGHIDLGGTIVLKIDESGKPTKVKTIKIGDGAYGLGTLQLHGDSHVLELLKDKSIKKLTEKAHNEFLKQMKKDGVHDAHFLDSSEFKKAGKGIYFFDTSKGKSKGIGFSTPSGNVFFVHDGKGKDGKPHVLKWTSKDGGKGKAFTWTSKAKTIGVPHVVKVQNKQNSQQNVHGTAQVKVHKKHSTKSTSSDVDAELRKLKSEIDKLRKQIRKLQRSKIL